MSLYGLTSAAQTSDRGYRCTGDVRVPGAADEAPTTLRNDWPAFTRCRAGRAACMSHVHTNEIVATSCFNQSSVRVKQGTKHARWTSVELQTIPSAGSRYSVREWCMAVACTKLCCSALQYETTYHSLYLDALVHLIRSCVLQTIALRRRLQGKGGHDFGPVLLK